MQKDIKQQWFLPYPPERVWKYLTEEALLQQWLMENDFKPRVGHQFQFNAKPNIKIGFDGKVFCEVLTARPFQKLSYTWKGGSGGKITLNSVVTWTLTAHDNGTDLSLEHTGFTGFKNYFAYLLMDRGWQKIAQRLAAQLAENKVSHH